MKENAHRTVKPSSKASAYSIQKKGRDHRVSTINDKRPEAIAASNLSTAISNSAAIQAKKNNTGLPDNLKSGIEGLSGHSMDDVKVHYNSSKPSQLNAHAYAQGTQIHLASGQDKHLPHEAWHVAQQKQGRVQPTTQVNGAAVNDDVSLENEADVMGNKALQLKATHKNGCCCGSCTSVGIGKNVAQSMQIVQRFCDLPGCRDKDCHDTENHKISDFRRLRNVDIYNANRDKSDIGTGSGTNQKTRDYVQNSKSFYPEEVSLSFSNQDGSYSGGSSYVQPPRTSGMKPDAGHIFGNQYGGSGKDTANIFAQEPRHNRGNKFKGKRTFEKWRRTENSMRQGIKKGYKMKAQAKLYRKKRLKYDESSISDEDYRAFMKKWYRRDDRDKGGGGHGMMT